MTPNKKLAIVLITGALVATASWYFLIYKPAHPKEDKKDDQTPPPDVSVPPTNNGLKPSPKPSPAPAPSVIGKTAYANKNNVTVLNADGSTYKMASAGEWIGSILSSEIKGGNSFYKVSGSRYVAAASVRVG